MFVERGEILVEETRDQDKKKNGNKSVLSEATTGFEPVIRVLQTLALPLGHVAVKNVAEYLWIIHPWISAAFERAKGLEPSTFSLARRRSTN